MRTPAYQGKNHFSYREKYGFGRSCFIVKLGRIVMVGSSRGIVSEVNEKTCRVSLDNGGTAIVLTIVIRAMREITSERI